MGISEVLMLAMMGHGGFGYGSRNTDGSRILEFADRQHIVLETGSQVGNICGWPGEKYS